MTDVRILTNRMVRYIEWSGQYRELMALQKFDTDPYRLQKEYRKRLMQFLRDFQETQQRAKKMWWYPAVALKTKRISTLFDTTTTTTAK